MSNMNDNNYTLSRQGITRAALTDKQADMIAELVRLYRLPSTPERDNLIAQWWVQCGMRVTDEEAVYFQKLKYDLFSEGNQPVIQ